MHRWDCRERLPSRCMSLLPCLLPPLYILPGKQVYWWLSFATAVDEEGAVTSSEDLCKSNQAVTSYTPAEVISWDCEYLSKQDTSW